MNAGSFRFELGDFNYPPYTVFANAPLERVEETIRGHDLPVDQVTTPYTCRRQNPGWFWQRERTYSSGSARCRIHRRFIEGC